VREIRLLRLTRRGLETGSIGSTYQAPRQSSTLPVRDGAVIR
jgi:hypothetical protein